MKPRVLVVDDSITVRMDLRAALSTAGFAVTSCGSKESALAALRVEPFELVILDILLPDGSGIDVLKEIKKTPEFGSIRVFMLSTEAEVRDRILGLKLGADLYVGKPYDRGYVARMARELLKMSDYAGPPTSRRSTSNRKILVVDDNPTFLKALALTLRADGNQIVTASSGDDALALLSVERFDAVLIDLIMPVIDGMETCRRLRLLPGLSQLPVALMTASTPPLPEAEAAAAGADEILDKPQNLSVMNERLRALILKKQPPVVPDEPSNPPVSSASMERALTAAGSPLYQQVIASSGLSELMARSVIDRSLHRIGVSRETLGQEDLARALPYIREALRTFLPHSETTERIAALARLAGSTAKEPTPRPARYGAAE
jgi:DNA-binding response OmpR family regulator